MAPPPVQPGRTASKVQPERMAAFHKVMEPEYSLITDVWDRFGFQGTILFILAYSARKFVLWAIPHVETAIRTHTENQTKLTDSTIEIQKEALTLLRSMDSKMPTVCKAQCPLPSYSLGHGGGQ